MNALAVIVLTGLGPSYVTNRDWDGDLVPMSLKPQDAVALPLEEAVRVLDRIVALGCPEFAIELQPHVAER